MKSSFRRNYPILIICIFLLLSIVLCEKRSFIPRNSKEEKIQNSRKQVIDGQIQQLLNKVKGKTIAILTNPTSVDGQMKPLFERLIEKQSQYNLTIKCFFAPQHGLRGDRQDGAGDIDYKDQQTGIWVYSLYGVRKAPQPTQLIGVDYLLYDIQDVGCRFYTFIWTLTYAIQALSKQNKVELLIFDRPNPLGRKVQGCPLNIDAGIVGRLLPGQSFTIPQQYGLTIGELISYLRRYLPTFKMSIIKMKEWYTLTDETWVMSSPNMPTLQTVSVYPGQGMFESSTMSQGRGTTKPFQITGFPGINPSKIIKYFSDNNVPGFGKSYYLRQNYFIPTMSKHQGQICGGVQIHIPSEELQNFNNVETSLNLIKAYLKVNKQDNINNSSIHNEHITSQISTQMQNSLINITTGIDKLFGRIGTRQRVIDPKYSASDILKQCQGDLEVYKKDYVKYWLYDTNKHEKIVQFQKQNQMLVEEE